MLWSLRACKAIIMGCLLFSMSFTVYAENATDTDSSDEANPPINQPLTLYIQVGKKNQGGTVKQFQMVSGDSVFIPVTGALSNQPTPLTSEQKGKLADKAQLAQVSEQISQKISSIRTKQNAIDNEIFPVNRASMVIEKIKLEEELYELQQSKTQLEAQGTVKDVVQEQQEVANESVPPQGMVSGFYIKPTLTGDTTVTIEMRSQGLKTKKDDSEIDAKIDATLGKWMQIPNKDVWVKVQK